MLIEATHSEETRVAIVNDTQLVDVDFESVSKKPLKGNVYLGKIIRVEPSLQAAFVEYGGNRHGFLPFSEIHPDYFRIPVSDRSAVQKALAEKEEKAIHESPDLIEISLSEEEAVVEHGTGEFEAVEPLDIKPDDEDLRKNQGLPDAVVNHEPLKTYKIQEVIKSRQVVLIQVIKEERGNKGAALTTYVSLAGRYCVLMPNASTSGGVSRKITDSGDRKRLRQLIQDLELPDGMSLIVRTAGMDRSKTEVRRDFNYLLGLWSEIRESTLKSTAPALIYEEGDLIKRALRDYYTRDIDEILVEGDEPYKLAKAFMRKLVPSHAKKVKQYRSEVPLFYKFSIEKQIDEMYYPQVKLRSGGYIVINPTEALVSIDVNSGRATKERHIDTTALKTNLEAAEEIARQVRLRDLAGLVVIDFIDMADSKHNMAVEKKLRDAMSDDRARIQIGRISNLGLLEMSRQRLRPSIVEISSTPCTQCGGTGLVRSTESMALQLLRVIEEECIAKRIPEMHIKVPARVGFYLLNEKRAALSVIEARYNVHLKVQQDEDHHRNGFRIEDQDHNLIQDTSTQEFSPSAVTEEGQKKGREGHPQRNKQRHDQHSQRKAANYEHKPKESKGLKEDVHPQESESLAAVPEEGDLVATGKPEEKQERSEGRHQRHKHRRMNQRRRYGQRRENREGGEEKAGSSGDASSSQGSETETVVSPPVPVENKEDKVKDQRPSRHRRYQGRGKNPILAGEEGEVQRIKSPQYLDTEKLLGAETWVPGASAPEEPVRIPQKRREKKKGWWQRLLDS
jgi:ribonuclease E